MRRLKEGGASFKVRGIIEFFHFYIFVPYAFYFSYGYTVVRFLISGAF